MRASGRMSGTEADLGVIGAQAEADRPLAERAGTSAAAAALGASWDGPSLLREEPKGKNP